MEAATSKPSIDRFSVSPPSVDIGQCVEVKWQVTGDAQSVKIGRNEVVLWDGAPLSGTMSDCPPSGVASYYLEVSGSGGSNRVQQNVSVVQSSPRPTSQAATSTPTSGNTPPSIDVFSVQPSQLILGRDQCVQIRWQVGGDANVVRILRGDVIVLGPAGISGQGQDCTITEAGDYLYTIMASSLNGQSASQAETVTAREEAVPLPEG